MATKAKQLYDMTEGALLPKLIKYSLPLVATGILQVFYNAADMIVVGRYAGDFAMGAVGACGSLINLIINAFIGLSVGTSICVAHAIGAKDDERVKRLVHTSLFLGVVFGIAVGVFGFFMAEPLLRMMETPESLLVEAVPYMRAYFVGVPAGLIYNFMAAALRSSGDSKRPLIFLALAGVLNVALNLVMVLGFGMGAIGVGIATSASQVASAVMIIVFLRRTGGPCRIRLRDTRAHNRELAEIVRTGVPASIQSVVFSLSNVLIQSSINLYGDVVVSGNTAASNIESFIYVSMNSIYQATLTFVGQHVGAGKLERIKKIVVLSVVLVSVIGLAFGMLAYVFHEPLLAIYKPGDDALTAAMRQAGANRMSIIATTYFLCGIMDVLSGTLRGMGKSVLPMGVAIFGSCLLRIAWIYTVCPLFEGNIAVLYAAYPVTWVVTLLGHLACCIVAYRRMVRLRDARLAKENSALGEAATAEV